MNRVHISDTELFELPFGYVDAEGKVHKSFGLRPLTGRIRKNVSVISKGKSLLEHLHTALQLIVTHIGPIENPSRDVITSLVTADRDHILYVARILDDSEERQEKECSKCGVMCGINVDISKETEFKMPGDGEVMLTKSRQGWVWSYAHEDRKAGVERAQLRLLTAGDEEEVARGDRKKADLNDMNHTLVARAVLDLNGDDTVTAAYVEDLKAKTIDSLKEKIESQSFGPDAEFSIQCPNCGSDEYFVVDTVSRFLGVGRPRAKQS